MSNNNRESRGSFRLNKDDAEKKILERFPILNDARVLHNYFSSYDFHENEEHMLVFWKDLLFYVYDSIKDVFAVKIDDILDITKIKNKRPICIHNILLKLIESGEYILESDLKNEEYYNKINSHKETWGAWMKKKVSNSFFFWKNNKENDLKHHDLLINKKLFNEHLENIKDILKMLNLNEDINVITISELRTLLINNIKYKDINLELCLNYLHNTNNLKLFKVKVENTEIECIKIKIDNDDVCEKDYAVVTIQMQLKKLDRKLDEINKVIHDCLEGAKDNMKKKNRNAAANLIKKKNVYLKAYETYSNMKLTLEQNLLDIKSMESSKGVKKVLEEAANAAKNFVINIDEFEKITDNLRSKDEHIKESNNIINTYNKENYDEEELEEELQILAKNMLEEKLEVHESIRFPSVIEKNKEKIIPSKNNDSFENILRELEMEK